MGRGRELALGARAPSPVRAPGEQERRDKQDGTEHRNALVKGTGRGAGLGLPCSTGGRVWKFLDLSSALLGVQFSHSPPGDFLGHLHQPCIRTGLCASLAHSDRCPAFQVRQPGLELG